MSQKQQERLEQQVDTEASEEIESTSIAPSPATPVGENVDTADAQERRLDAGDDQPAAEVPQKKRKKRKAKWVSVEEILPKPSYWPLALTVSLCVLLMGVMIHPIVIGVGAILVIISVIGWMLERR